MKCLKKSCSQICLSGDCSQHFHDWQPYTKIHKIPQFDLFFDKKIKNRDAHGNNRRTTRRDLSRIKNKYY